MAKCDEGYRCDICQQDVEIILDSDLYLRFILGEVKLEQLHLQRERHIRCNPSLAQYIVDSAFTPIACDGPFSKSEMDVEFQQAEELRVTTAWRRLQSIPTLGLSIAEYPL